MNLKLYRMVDYVIAERNNVFIFHSLKNIDLLYNIAIKRYDNDIYDRKW